MACQAPTRFAFAGRVLLEQQEEICRLQREILDMQHELHLRQLQEESTYRPVTQPVETSRVGPGTAADAGDISF
jgi:hypothetical protein